MKDATRIAAVVDTNTCDLLTNPENPFLLVLKLGEDLFESILQCATKMKLKSASLSGLGALDNVTLAYYNLHTKTFQPKLFSKIYELISLDGNITIVEDKPYAHIHVALGSEDFSVIGGHLMSATVSANAEILVTPLAAPVIRKYNKTFESHLICPA